MNWSELFDMKNSREWYKCNVYATTTKDVTMYVWNGQHYPTVSANMTEHTCKAGTKVLVWMVSRMGDVGITDNLIDARGYDARVDVDEYLTNIEIEEF